MFKDISPENLYAFADQAVPCVGFNTRRATRLVTQYYDLALAPAGLRSTQYSLLTVLSMAGDIAIQELAFVLAMDRTTLTRNLAPLQNRQLVGVAAGRDRRIRLVHLTPQGQATLEAAHPLWSAAQTTLVSRLGEANWGQIRQGLHQISMIVEETMSQLGHSRAANAL